MQPEMLFIQRPKNPESPSKSFESSCMDLSQRSLNGPDKITLFVLSLSNNFRVGFWCSENPSIFLMLSFMFSFCVFVLCFRFMFSFCVFILCFCFLCLLLVLKTPIPKCEYARRGWHLWKLLLFLARVFSVSKTDGVRCQC